MIPLFFKILTIVFVWFFLTLGLGIRAGGWADDHYGTGAMVTVVCALVILSVLGLVVLLILIVPYLV